MQDTRTNRLEMAAENEKLKKLFGQGKDAEAEELIRKEFDATGKIRRLDQGPIFREGEIVAVKGYGYKIHALVGQRIILKPHGPLEVVATVEDGE